MFIRRTQTRNTASGETYHTHRLVRSARVDGKVKQLTLLNLGRHFDLDQAHWPALCVRLEELLSGQAGLLPAEGPAAVERHAQRIAAQLLARGQPAAESPVPAPGASGDVQAVDVDSLELVRPRTVGVEAAGLWAMAQVDFVGLLGELGFTGPQRTAALGSILGRMAAPGSELSTFAWLGERSGLGELLGVDFEAMSLSALYRISDRLLASKAALEDALFGRVQDLFGFTTRSLCTT